MAKSGVKGRKPGFSRQTDEKKPRKNGRKPKVGNKKAPAPGRRQGL
jgi:hypothetical protein